MRWNVVSIGTIVLSSLASTLDLPPSEVLRS